LSQDPRIDALQQAIRDVPDFPKPGIVFKDITPLLGSPERLRDAADLMAEQAQKLGATRVVAIESRGFILGSLVAERLKAGFVPVRKPGKLPAETLSASYELEYGTDTLEIHKDALAKGESVLVVDDVIATGGTAKATAELVEKLGGRVAAFAFLVELGFLSGRDKLGGYQVLSVLRY
jgi:adenine phosphoribosyltransferase